MIVFCKIGCFDRFSTIGSKMYAWEKKYGGIDIENDIIHANEHQLYAFSFSS